MSCARLGWPARMAGEQVAVLVDAVEEMGQAVEHEVPDAQRQVEVALERLLQVGVARPRVDAAVDLGVQTHERVGVAAALARVDLGDERVELLALIGRQALGGAPRRVPFELDAHVGDRREVGDVDLRGEGAAARIDRDEALERQALDRLAHRSATHLELAPERVLVDRRARRDGQGDDTVAQLGVGTIGEQLAGDRNGRVGAFIDHWPEDRYISPDDQAG